MAKRKKSTTTSEAPVMACSIDGCSLPGAHKAPKSKSALHDYQWYCLDHVRERNLKWDFFEGMNRDEIEAFMRDALTGHRPTWDREGHANRYWDALHEALDVFLESESVARKKHTKATARLNARVREALSAFNLDYPYDTKTLKAKYRTLVKQYHPDANKGDRKAEEAFKRIATAYLILAEHLKNDS